ncbi:MAG: hypothetical protein AAGJ40_21065 [Planctomycetota bacterium]
MNIPSTKALVEALIRLSQHRVELEPREPTEHSKVEALSHLRRDIDHDARGATLYLQQIDVGHHGE